MLVKRGGYLSFGVSDYGGIGWGVLGDSGERLEHRRTQPDLWCGIPSQPVTSVQSDGRRTFLSRTDQGETSEPTRMSRNAPTRMTENRPSCSEILDKLDALIEFNPGWTDLGLEQERLGLVGEIGRAHV